MFSEPQAKEEHAVWVDGTNIRLLAADDALKLIRKKFGSLHHILHLYRFDPVDFPVIDFLHENNFHADAIFPPSRKRCGDLRKVDDRVKNRFNDHQILVAVSRRNWSVVQYLIDTYNLDFNDLLNRNINMIFSKKSSKSYPHLMFTLLENNVSFNLDRFRKPIEDYSYSTRELEHLMLHHDFTVSPHFLHDLPPKDLDSMIQNGFIKIALSHGAHLPVHDRLPEKVLTSHGREVRHKYGYDSNLQAIEILVTEYGYTLSPSFLEHNKDSISNDFLAVLVKQGFEIPENLSLRQQLFLCEKNLLPLEISPSFLIDNKHSSLSNELFEFAVNTGAQIPMDLSLERLLFLNEKNLIPLDHPKQSIKNHKNTNWNVIQQLVSKHGYILSPCFLENHRYIPNEKFEFAIRNGAAIPQDLPLERLLVLHEKNLVPDDYSKTLNKYYDNFQVIQTLVNEFGYSISPSVLNSRRACNDIKFLCLALRNGTKGLSDKKPIKFHENLSDIEYLVVEHGFRISYDFFSTCDGNFLENLSKEWICFLRNHGASLPYSRSQLEITRNMTVERVIWWELNFGPLILRYEEKIYEFLEKRMLTELTPQDFSEYCCDLLLMALKMNLQKAISILCKLECYDGITACPNYQWCIQRFEEHRYMDWSNFTNMLGCMYVIGRRDFPEPTKIMRWSKNAKKGIATRDLLCECVNHDVELKLRDIFGFLRPARTKKYGRCDVFVWTKKREFEFFENFDESVELERRVDGDLMKLKWCLGLDVVVRQMDDGNVDIFWVESVGKIVELFVNGVECLAKLIGEYCGHHNVRMNFFKNRVLGSKTSRDYEIVKLAADVGRKFFCVYTKRGPCEFRVGLFRVTDGCVSSLISGGSVV